MERNTRAQTGPEAPPSDPVALDQWLAELNELTSTFTNAREQARRHRKDAHEDSLKAERWDKAAAEALEKVIQLMRGRCGNDFVTALTRLGQEIHQEEQDAEELDDVDEDTRFGLPPDDMAIDLNQRFE